MSVVPRVSVILPAYNAAEHIHHALDALVQQTYDAWECLVINDGSTDETAAIAHGYARKDARFHVIDCAHQGIVSALNTAISAARGMYIARMDADDTCARSRLAYQSAFLDATPDIDVVSSRVDYTGLHTRHGGFFRYVAWTNTLITPYDHALNRFIDAPVIHPTVMLRRDVYERYGGYREEPYWPEDFELWLRLMANGVRFQKIPQKLYTWHEQDTRLSRTDARYALSAFYACKAAYLAGIVAAAGGRCAIGGAGRCTRQRARMLEEYGVEISCYLDVDERRRGTHIAGCPIYMMDELDKIPDVPLLVYVSTRGAREGIRERLKGTRFNEGTNFWCAA